MITPTQDAAAMVGQLTPPGSANAVRILLLIIKSNESSLLFLIRA